MTITSKLFVLAIVIFSFILVFIFLPQILKQDPNKVLPDSNTSNSENLNTTSKNHLYYKSTSNVLNNPINGKKQSIADITEILDDKNSLLSKLFSDANAPYPPQKISFLFFKQEKKLEVWALKSNHWVFIVEYPILAASGKSGPKFRESDRQVPEGFYQLESLNPNSSYHLSMKINFPNEDDLAQARTEDRENVGSDIFIHGKNVSIGCLAMGDETIETLFLLATKVELANFNIIISPIDFRNNDHSQPLPTQPAWVKLLYEKIKLALNNYSKP